MSRQEKISTMKVEEKVDLLLIRNKTKRKELQINKEKQCADTIKAV
jgi:hypothetical protein